MKKFLKCFPVKLWILLFALLVLTFFSNDFGLVDIQKTALVLAAGIDRDEDGFRLTAQIAVPKGTDRTTGGTSSVEIEGRGSTVSECEQTYIRTLEQSGVVQAEDLPQTEVSGVIEEIRSAVLDGNTWYYIRLENSHLFYAIQAKDDQNVVLLDVGDRVTIQHELGDEDADILKGVSVIRH